MLRGDPGTEVKQSKESGTWLQGEKTPLCGLLVPPCGCLWFYTFALLCSFQSICDGGRKPYRSFLGLFLVFFVMAPIPPDCI